MIDASLEEILNDLRTKNQEGIQSLLKEIENKYKSNAEYILMIHRKEKK